MECKSEQACAITVKSTDVLSAIATRKYNRFDIRAFFMAWQPMTNVNSFSSQVKQILSDSQVFGKLQIRAVPFPDRSVFVFS